MKKIFSSVMLFVAAAIAFVSCQKHEPLASESSQEVTLTFASEKPVFDDNTRTEWTGEGIQWSAGDKIAIAYTVDGEWMGYKNDETGELSTPKLYKSESLVKASEIAKFNVSGSFNIKSEGSHVFYGVYPAPSSTDFSDAPIAKLSVPTLQTPLAESFDGSADLMTGVSVDDFTTLPASEEKISMAWTRLVAHADITLKSIKGITADESILTLTLTAQEGANLVGQQKVNLLTNEVVKDNSISNVLKLNGGNLSVVNGNIEFWACILPATLTALTVELETDKATYTREITGLSKTFKQNARNTLSIKMDNATRVEKAAESWVLVTPADGITEGTYALVATTKTKTGVLISSNGTSSAPTYNTSVSVNGNVLKGVTETMQFDITGASGNYVISVGGDAKKWLYCTNSNNGVRVGTSTNKTWTISQHSKNSNAFVFKHNSTGRYLGVYNNADWRCYTSETATNFTNTTGSSQIYLYKKISGAIVPDPTPSEPEVPVKSYVFKKVNSVTSGKSYLMVADGNVAKPITSNYGYLNVETPTITNDEIVLTSLDNAFVISEVSGAYTIKQSDDRYLYQTGTYNSFNVAANPASGNLWSIELTEDKAFKITNSSVKKWIQYSSQYSSYGSYNNEQGTLPHLYELVED